MGGGERAQEAERRLAQESEHGECRSQCTSVMERERPMFKKVKEDKNGSVHWLDERRLLKTQAKAGQRRGWGEARRDGAVNVEGNGDRQSAL